MLCLPSMAWTMRCLFFFFFFFFLPNYLTTNRMRPIWIMAVQMLLAGTDRVIFSEICTGLDERTE